MTIYEITVNGKSYDVTVQKKKMPSSTLTSETKTVVSIPPVVSVPKTVAPVLTAGKKIVAPMPGKIIDIKVRVGDSVKQGHEMIIMEAMKMHNPILAPHEGVVTEIFVQINDSVQSGQALITIG